jgi:SAM-dependent methyltransferase
MTDGTTDSRSTANSEPVTTLCPICSADATSHLHALHDDRFGYPGEFVLLGCDACGHRWLDWRPDAARLAALYTDYYPRSTRSVDDLTLPKQMRSIASWWHGQRSSAAFWVPPRVTVLDIGCGFGESLAYHRGRGCEVWGVEADQNIARVAAHHGFNVHVGLFDPTLYKPASFDYVTMDQVIEHVIDPIATLRGVYDVLKRGGTAVLTTPNASSLTARMFGRRWINWHTPYHMHFFTPRSLRRAAELAGLEVASIKTITSSEWLSYQWIHLLTYPPAGTTSPFWTTRRRRAWEQVTIKGLRALHRLGVDQLTTRILDAASVGDNYVVQLRRAA